MDSVQVFVGNPLWGFSYILFMGSDIELVLMSTT